jgi:hypothetical protein
MACKLTRGPTPQDPTYELIQLQPLSLNIPAAHVKSLTGCGGQLSLASSCAAPLPGTPYKHTQSLSDGRHSISLPLVSSHSPKGGGWLQLVSS